MLTLIGLIIDPSQNPANQSTAGIEGLEKTTILVWRERFILDI